MSNVVSSRLMRKWWLMLAVGVVIGLVIGGLLPEDLFGYVVA